MAHEGLGGVEVVALGAGHAAREEGVPAVGPLVAAALVTPDTVACKQSFKSRTGRGYEDCLPCMCHCQNKEFVDLTY